MGRGLHNIEMRSEQILHQFSTYLQANVPGSTRCAAIYKVEAEYHSHLSNIKEYLRVRYAMAEEVTAKSLGAAQIAQLYSDILKKDRHKKLYNVRENEQALVVDFSVWLKHGNKMLARQGTVHSLTY
ncbi:hypothetical protein PAEPH01_0985 [Pancytospora epiphaga]|nr:hypothetical protein PAEPH01_0985 [Pancytospora epiphaga]